MSAKTALSRKEMIAASLGGGTSAPALAVRREADPRTVGLAMPERPVMSIELDMIEEDPDQDRHEFDVVELAELAASMKARGQLLPGAVYWLEPSKKYRLIDGARRFRAARIAGRPSFSAEIYPERPEDFRERQLEANLHRIDLNPIEFARAVRKRVNAGDSQQKVADDLHVGRATISRAMSLLGNLHIDVQQLVEEKALAPSVAYLVSQLPRGDQPEFADYILRKKCNRARVEALVRDKLGKPPTAHAQSLGFGEPQEPHHATNGVHGETPQAPQTAASTWPAEPPRAAPIAEAPGSLELKSERAEPRLTRDPKKPFGDLKPHKGYVTLEDGSRVDVEYDGGTHLVFHGPITHTGYHSHFFNSSEVNEGESLQDYAQRVARKEHVEDLKWVASQKRHDAKLARQAESHLSTLNDETRGAQAVPDFKPVEGYETYSHGGGSEFVYVEPGSELGDEDSRQITCELPVGSGWRDLISCLVKAFHAAKWNAALSEVRPAGANPGDRVRVDEKVNTAHGMEGVIEYRIDDLVRVHFKDETEHGRTVCFRGGDLIKLEDGEQ